MKNTAAVCLAAGGREAPTDFRGISRLYVKSIIEKLNNRPRKKNGFRKPKDMIKEK